jgi:hypothetical protein
MTLYRPEKLAAALLSFIREVALITIIKPAWDVSNCTKLRPNRHNSPLLSDNELSISLQLLQLRHTTCKTFVV